MAGLSSRSERVAARVPTRVYRALRRAADLSGATLNQFLVQAALEKAELIIEREAAIRLSETDSRRLLELLDAPPPLNSKLAAARQRYAKARKNRADHSFDWSP